MLCFPASPFGQWLSCLKGAGDEGVACLCQAETRLQGCKTSVCSQTHTHTSSPSPSLCFTPAGFSSPASARSGSAFFSSPSFFSLSSVFHSLCLTSAETHSHTHMHSFPPLSPQSFIKRIMTVRFGENSETLCHFGGDFP